MYLTLLSLHSIFRWFVLAGMLLATAGAYRGWIRRRDYLPADNMIRHWAATVAHIQLGLGLFLYSASPLVDYFLHHFNDAVKEREVRFFGMEHSFMMILAVTVVTIGSIKAKRQKTSLEKFRTVAIWYSIGLLIIISSVPWPFSPLTSRPYLRPF